MSDFCIILNKIYKSKSKIEGYIVLPKLKFFTLLALGFVFCLTDAINGKVIKGPYLIFSGVNTEMNVLWQTDNHAKLPDPVGYRSDIFDRNSTKYGVR